MCLFSKKKINKTLSTLKRWIPDLKISENELGTVIQATVDYSAMGISSWTILIIFGTQNRKDKDRVKVYFVKPNIQELSLVLKNSSLKVFKFIKKDSYNNSYLSIKKTRGDEAVNIIASIIAALVVLEKHNTNNINYV